MLWSLWAAKEAVFKAVARERPSTVFAPSRFEVEPGRGSEASCVVFEGLRLSVAWTQGPDWVHAWLLGGALLAVERCLPEQDPGLAVRDLARRTLLAAGYPPGSVVDRPPVYRTLLGHEVPVSLSHDGPWLAVSAPFSGIDERPVPATPVPGG